MDASACGGKRSDHHHHDPFLYTRKSSGRHSITSSILLSLCGDSSLLCRPYESHLTWSVLGNNRACLGGFDKPNRSSKTSTTRLCMTLGSQFSASMSKRESRL